MHTIRFETIDSTQLEAKRILMSGSIREDTLLIADTQTGGIGRSGAKWHSYSGNVLITCVLCNMNEVRFSNINSIVIGTLVHKVLCNEYNALDNKLQLKWQNDIFIHRKKICGIIVSIEVISGRVYFVIGIGINLVKHPKLEDAWYDASDLLRETGFHFSRDNVIDEIVERIRDELHDSIVRQDLYTDYFIKNAFGIGEGVSCIAGNGILQGFTREGEAIVKIGIDDKIINSGSLKFIS